MKHLYAQTGMREMCDVDILFDGAFRKDLHDWFICHGYQERLCHWGAVDGYVKQPFYNVEMHISLFDPLYNPDWTVYWKDIRTRLLPDQNKPCSYRYHLCNEDVYLYTMLHMYRHYDNSGTGLRSLLDCYVMLMSYGSEMDQEEIQQKLSELGIAEFEEQARTLATLLFENPEKFSPECLTLEQNVALEEFITNGTYGTMKNRVQRRLSDIQSETETSLNFHVKFRYLRQRIFPKPEHIMAWRPIFSRRRWLLPVGYMHRLLVLGVTERGKRMHELNVIRKM